ncbi:hypothetical protein BIY29_01335 [Brenneria alni]|uniref:Uncharacterized protein n=1 Tax=Brenneria alni TaxID=71656 RepID=A0A421DTB1_9GAMM|nr:hypothetical protein [Brenneria alni]RLM27756.1 hypothetical protein BIY29_01335 [Brenneria alni]
MKGISSYADTGRFEEISLASSSYSSILYDSIRDRPDFKAGLSEQAHLAAKFESEAKYSVLNGFSYISKHVNPHKKWGMLINLSSFAKDANLSLHRNCIYCSKAVDLNINAMVDNNYNTFYVAEKTEAGELGEDIAAMQQYPVTADTSVSTLLLSNIKQGERAIIVVPLKKKNFSHCMNFIHHAGDGIVVDGQQNKLYNFNNNADKKIFDSLYGAASSAIKPARIYITGKAPDIRNEAWEMIEHPYFPDNDWEEL